MRQARSKAWVCIGRLGKSFLRMILPRRVKSKRRYPYAMIRITWI